jgi:hypothetical protein
MVVKKAYFKDEDLVRIDRRAARKLFDLAKAVYMYPGNMREGSMWASPVRASGETFDKCIDAFAYYNSNGLSFNRTIKLMKFYTSKKDLAASGIKFEYGG